MSQRTISVVLIHVIIFFSHFRFQWAGLHRIHIRLQKGIPPMHDLLTVDQEYVVRAVAYALRNMSIDATNKWSIGRKHFIFFINQMNAISSLRNINVICSSYDVG